MKKVFVYTALLLFVTKITRSQFTTLNDPVTFSTTDQNMFGLTPFNLNIEIPLFSRSWNVPFGPFGEIDTTILGKYGYEISGLTRGDLEFRFYSRNWDDGSVDIDYPVNIQTQYPTANTIDRGSTIKIKSDYTVDPSANMVTTFPQVGNVGMEFEYNMRFALDPTLCFVGCSDAFGFDFTIADVITIFDLSTAGLKYPCIDNIPTSFYCTDAFLPVSADFGYGLSGTFDLPNVTTTSSIGADKCLYATGEDQYASLQLEIFKLLSEIPWPPARALGLLSFDECLRGGGAQLDACLSYTIFSAYFEAAMVNKQDFSFCPDIYTTYKFPIPVEYSVINPNSGSTVETGRNDEIRIEVGNDIDLVYPCNYDYLDVETSHEIENEFTNHTYDEIRFSFNMEALAFEIRITAFGLGENDDDAGGSSDGFNFGLGPLWETSIPLGSIPGIDWFDETFELPGFTSVAGQSFRLDAREYKAVTLGGRDIDCYGDENGGFDLQITNGVTPFTFNWSDGNVTSGSSRNVSYYNLPAGNGYVVIADANNCYSYAAYHVEGPKDPVRISSEIVEPVTCNGANDGKITIEVHGGTPSYNYSWTTASGGSSVTNVAGGNETVTVTDSKGCTASKTIEMPEPAVLNAQFDITDVSCFGDSNGVVIAVPEGGTAPYTYLWSNGSTGQTSINWSAGTHSLDLSDANGCSNTFTFTVGGPAQPIAISETINDITCFGFDDGSVSVSVTGGTAPYTYQWSDSNYNQHLSTGTSATDLYPSRWNLSITDDNGCITFAAYNVNEPRALDFTDTLINVSCFGGSDGSIDISPYGGVLPYNYNWSNGVTVQDNLNISAGNYSVTLTDNNGCTKSRSYTITQPLERLTTLRQQENISCKDADNGRLGVSPKGGTAPYSYLWTTGDTTSGIDSLAPGNYGVTITDAQGCQLTESFTITEPDSLIVTSRMDSVRCHSFSDGRLTAIVTGGTMPYIVAFGDSNYSRFNTDNSFVFDSLPAANYYISATDANGCIYLHAVEVLEPDTLLWETDSTDVSCFGGSDGAADLTVTGGVQPYFYQWKDSLDKVISTNQDLTNVSAGYYTVQVTDFNSCVIDGYVTILQPDSIQIFDTAYSTTCLENNDGKIEIEVIGGVGNYTYQWSNGEVSQNIMDLASGTYTVEVRDFNNCPQYDTVFVPKSLVDCIDPPNAFTPDGDGYNDTWVIDNIQNYEGARITIFNKWGKILYESDNSYEPWDGKVNGKALPSATYYYYIDLNRDGRIYKGPLTIVKSN